jgi:hypothetical protein
MILLAVVVMTVILNSIGGTSRRALTASTSTTVRTPSYQVMAFSTTTSTDGRIAIRVNELRQQQRHARRSFQQHVSRANMSNSKSTIGGGGGTSSSSSNSSSRSSEAIRRDWVEKSIRYYSTVMREERRKQLGQIPPAVSTSSNDNHHDDSHKSDVTPTTFEKMAYRHYFALRKVKDGKPHHAERIYRRIIQELQDEEEHDCDHAKLAVTTLLLALHLQRSNDSKATRSVFLHFFRTVVTSNPQQTVGDATTHHQCACSAKVLQAFALFEMKQGHALKSLELVTLAIRFDPSLTSILNWKQFRDVQARKQQLMLRQKS